MASNSGCKYKFVSEPDDALKCLICLEMAEEPLQHEGCGKLFCRKCLEDYGREQPCANCRGQQQYFEDHKSKRLGVARWKLIISSTHYLGRREISSLPVRCGVDGCSEVMELQHIQQHARACKHNLVACKYANIGCKEELGRRQMAAHEEDTEVHLYLALERINFLQENAGIIRFKLTGFQQQKYRNREVRSSAYYIYPKGYHMAVKVYANGTKDGEDTHVSVFAPIVEGRYDANLKWPFLGKVTFTLLNQLADKNHHQTTVELTAEKNALIGSAWGFFKFIPHSALDYDPDADTQYLKDDTLYFRMSVEVNDHKSWLE